MSVERADGAQPSSSSIHTEGVENAKAVHTIVLDTAPILLNTPSISTLLANSHALVTTRSVISEVRGEEARNRLETLYRPFLTVRSPKPESVKFVREFARRTGDVGVLSDTDIDLLALAYDLECERNGGDWRLRNAPGQKRLNGGPPLPQEKPQQEFEPKTAVQDDSAETSAGLAKEMQSLSVVNGSKLGVPLPAQPHDEVHPLSNIQKQEVVQCHDDKNKPSLDKTDDNANAETDGQISSERSPNGESFDEPSNLESDSEGWITPSNIKRHQALEDDGTNPKRTQSEPKTMQVATMTGDFAMQNVLLQMNLNLLSTKTCKRVSNIKQMILRCHGCFTTTRDMTKQFCPRCGKPTLTRVTCTTNDKGEVKLHLKANHQWNNRGNVFSIPKPISGSANQKWKGPRQGGGQKGWGSDLILAEDQKEYVRALSGQHRSTRKKDLMDEDSLPSIITGERDRRGGGGRIQVGAGRNVNSRKR